MPFKNPIHEKIYEQVVRPTLSNRKLSVEGYVQQVDYYNQTLRVYWRDPDSGTERESANVPIPQDGDGVYKQAIEEGDHVTLSFRNGNHDSPFVSIIHKKARGVSFESKNGASIPKGMSFL
ncbi:hypothetical protein QO179_24655 [Bacillus stercoris]|nr:hypothetical protein [Bacillus stercoris]